MIQRLETPAQVRREVECILIAADIRQWYEALGYADVVIDVSTLT